MAKPNALAMPSRLTAVGPDPMPPTTAAPQPKNTRAKVPTNSASCLFIAQTPPKLTSIGGAFPVRARSHYIRVRLIRTGPQPSPEPLNLAGVRACAQRCFSRAGGYISDAFRVNPRENGAPFRVAGAPV